MRKTAEHVVANLVAAGLVDAGRSDEAETVVARALGERSGTTATPPEKPTTTRGLLVEIAAYVGGALVIASIALFLGQEWADFSDTARVATFAGIAVLLAVFGVGVARVGGGHAEMREGRDEVRRRLTSALLTGASLAAAFAVGQAVSNQIDDVESSMPVLAGSLTMLALAVVAYAYAPSALALLATAAAGWNAVMNGWMVLDESAEASILPSLTMLAFALVWLVLAETGRFREVMVARTAGMVIALFGAQIALTGGDHANLAYAFTFAVAVAGFAMYLRTAAWPYLVAGVLGVTIVVPEAVIDWTGGELGPAGAVLVAGLTLLGASLVGFRARREVGQDTEPDASDEKHAPPSVHVGR